MKLLPRLLALVSALVLPLALVAVWADQVVTETDRYVATVSPLAEDPAVQEAAAARVAAATNALVRDRVGPTAAVRVGVLSEQAALRVVRSESFASAWRAANRAAHDQFERAMNDDRDAPVILDLSGAVGDVLERLAPRAPAVAGLDTGSSLRVRAASSESVERARTAYGALDAFGVLTGVAWALLLLAALALGSDRRAVLAVASAATAVTTALLWLGLWLGDDVAVAAVAATDRPLVRAVYDVLTDDLELWTGVALGASLVVALLNFLIPEAKRDRAAT